MTNEQTRLNTEAFPTRIPGMQNDGDWIVEGKYEGKRFVGNDIRKLSASLTIWILLALVGSNTAYIAMQGTEFSLWWSTFKPMTAYYLMWAAVAPIVFQLAIRDNYSVSRALTTVFMHVVLFTVVTASQLYVVRSGDWPMWLFTERATGFYALSLTIYVSVIFVCLLLKHSRAAIANEREMKNFQLSAKTLENQLNLARLDLFANHLGPHFILNALNGASALIERRQLDDASELVCQLGDLLRSTIQRMDIEEIPLADEVDFVQRFVKMQRLRVPVPVRLFVSIPDPCKSILVPPMILQPIVENSLKYAAQSIHGRIDIFIDSKELGGKLAVRITDNGTGTTETVQQTHGTGYGLKSIRERLALLYGDEAELRVELTGPNNNFVELIVPSHRSTTAEAA